MLAPEGQNVTDQAEGLRRQRNPKPVKVLAVTGGKGGVGKTSVSINLAIALAERGRRVVLMDADLGLANIDVLPVQGINVYDILRRGKLVLSKAAIEALEERFK